MKVERGILVALEVQELKRRPELTYPIGSNILSNFYHGYKVAEGHGFAYEYEFAYKQARNIGNAIEGALNIAYRFFLLHLGDFERGGVLEPHEFDQELYDMLTISLERKPEDIDRKDLINV